jgi:hypothetical protein
MFMVKPRGSDFLNDTITSFRLIEPQVGAIVKFQTSKTRRKELPMSLQHNTTTPRKNAVSLRAGGFTFAMRQMFAPLVHQVSEGRHARKIEETRRATQREIASLPASLQQDVAFADGTVIELEHR